MQRLHGVRVLVTRPEPAARRLAEAFAAEGAEALRAPALAIVSVEDTMSVERLRERLAEVAAVVFTSVNAVEGFFEWMDRPEGRHPRDTSGADTAEGCLGPAAAATPARPPPACLAVGRATAEALRGRGVADVHIPSGRFDSEGLLACPQLDARRVAGRLVAVVKGEGGRDLLAKTLRRRGAEVFEADVYRRRAPRRLARMLHDVRGSVDVVTVTSAEALDNIVRAAPWTTRWLSGRVVVAAGERVAGIARDLGLPRVVAARGADAASMVEATVRAVADRAVADPSPDRGTVARDARFTGTGPSPRESAP